MFDYTPTICYILSFKSDVKSGFRRLLGRSKNEDCIDRIIENEAEPKIETESDDAYEPDYVLRPVTSGKKKKVMKIRKRLIKIGSRLSSPSPAEPKSNEKRNGIELIRFPSGTFPKKIELNKIANLNIHISEKQVSVSGVAGEVTEKIVIKIPSDEGKEVKLRIAIGFEPSNAFTSLDGFIKAVEIPESGEPEPTIFRLEAIAECDAQVYVNFLHESSVVGRLDFDCTILKRIQGKIEDTSKKSQLNVKNNSPPVDLTLVINEITKKTYTITLFSHKINTPVATFPLKFTENPKTMFRQYFIRLENIAEDRQTNVTDLEKQIRAIGMELYNEIFREQALKDIYWENRTRIKSIRVFSTEPWTPWEMIKPFGETNGEIIEDEFLCEKIFSRWLPQMKANSKQELKTILVVAPSNTGLKGVTDEKAFIKEFATDRNLPPVTNVSKFTDVITKLEIGGFDVLHFCSHGKYNEEYTQFSELSLYDTPLSPENITGKATNFGSSHPLVIINACQLGRNGFSLTGLGGWAPKFLRVGASAFIGAMWNVLDDTAIEFTKNLYGKIGEGAALDEAVQFARMKSRKQGDPTWLAYTLYSHTRENVIFANNELTIRN